MLTFCLHKIINLLQEESRALQPDGQILTESKVTTEHEEINDEDLPEDEVNIFSRSAHCSFSIHP